jgi:hypothetical protein
MAPFIVFGNNIFMKTALKKFGPTIEAFREMLRATHEGIYRAWNDPSIPISNPPQRTRVGEYECGGGTGENKERDALAKKFKEACDALEQVVVRKGQVNRAFQLGVARPYGDVWYETRKSWGNIRGKTWSSSYMPEQAPGKPRIVIDAEMRVARSYSKQPLDETIKVSLVLEQPVATLNRDNEIVHEWAILDTRVAIFGVEDIKSLKVWLDERLERMGIEAYTISRKNARFPSEYVTWTRDIGPTLK